MPPPLPYADLSKVRGRYHGPVAILANGATLTKVLAPANWRMLADFPTISMNRSWEVLWPTVAHVVAEEKHFKDDPEMYAVLAREGKLFVVGAHWPIGYRLKISHSRIVNAFHFSEDVMQGVVVGTGTTGTMAYCALQLAVYLGFNPIYFLGLDLHGPHYHKKWPTDERKLLDQNRLFLCAAETLKGRVKVYNVGSPRSKCTAFPKLTFSQAFNRRRIA